MTTKNSTLADRRDHLVAQIAYERALIAQHATSLKRLSRIIDGVNQGVRYVKKHPEVLLLPAAIAVISRPRRLLASAMSALGMWRMSRTWRQRLLHRR